MIVFVVVPSKITAKYNFSNAIFRIIGNVKAVRAVARACATNPVAIITPCHRVIGTNGSLSGYRWGIERKKTILENEKALKK